MHDRNHDVCIDETDYVYWVKVFYTKRKNIKIHFDKNNKTRQNKLYSDPDCRII